MDKMDKMEKFEKTTKIDFFIFKNFYYIWRAKINHCTPLLSQHQTIKLTSSCIFLFSFTFA